MCLPQNTRQQLKIEQQSQNFKETTFQGRQGNIFSVRGFEIKDFKNNRNIVLFWHDASAIKSIFLPRPLFETVTYPKLTNYFVSDRYFLARRCRPCTLPRGTAIIQMVQTQILRDERGHGTLLDFMPFVRALPKRLQMELQQELSCHSYLFLKIRRLLEKFNPQGVARQSHLGPAKIIRSRCKTRGLLCRNLESSQSSLQLQRFIY